MDYRLAWRRRIQAGHAAPVSNGWAVAAAILLILGLSAAVHAANPLGQPGIWWDEGTYIKRAIVTTEQGVLYPRAGDMDSNFAYYGQRYYGHPFMGWALLAAFFAPLGYPGFLRDAPDSVATLGTYFLVPRAITIALTVLATYPVIRVGEKAFGRLRYGLAAGTLYAVTPLSRSLAYVQLDNFMAFWVLLALHWALIARDRADLRRRYAYALLAGAGFGMAVMSKLPAVVLLPLFPMIFWRDIAALFRPRTERGLEDGHPSRRVGVLTLALWLVATVGVFSLWLLYALARGETDRLTSGLRIFVERDVGGWSFADLIDRFFRGADPFLFYSGLAGLLYALVRFKPLAAAWAGLYLLYLLVIPGRIQYYVLPLVVPFVLLGGFVLADIALAVPQGLERVLRPRANAGPGAAAKVGGAAILALILLFPMVQTSFLASQDNTGPRLQGLEWLVENAQPYSVAVVNRAFLFALQERRPDLWVVHAVQTDTTLLDQWKAKAEPPPPALSIVAAGGQVVFRGTVPYGASLSLAAGRYVVTGTRGGQPAGYIAVNLDRDRSLVFVDPTVRVLELYDKGEAFAGSAHRLTLLDPGAMPIYWLDDGTFTLPKDLRARLSSPEAFFANAWVKASVYKLAP